MLKTIRFFALCAFALGLLAGFYFLPSGEVVSEPGNSPLYAASLSNTTDHLNGDKGPARGTDGKGGGEGNFVTCELTCGPTCNQTTCGATCVATCAFTCTNTCSQTTCQSTCVATCASTCANTCSQSTCASTCVVTCSYTCFVGISMISFGADVENGDVVVRWSTASEVDNFRFIIWRSTDPQAEFTAIADVPCTGRNGSTSYSFVDENAAPGVTYYYKISDVSVYGYETLHSNLVSAIVKADLTMAQNYPNPFNPETVIRFTLPAPAQTRLSVYDMSGRMVKTLVNGYVSGGTHEVTWNAADESGSILPSGMYLYRLQAGELTASGKMVYVK